MSWFLRNALVGLLIIWLVFSVFGFLMALGFSGSLNYLLQSPGAWLVFGGPWLIAIVLGIYWKVRPE